VQHDLLVRRQGRVGERSATPHRSRNGQIVGLHSEFSQVRQDCRQIGLWPAAERSHLLDPVQLAAISGELVRCAVVAGSLPEFRIQRLEHRVDFASVRLQQTEIQVVDQIDCRFLPATLLSGQDRHERGVDAVETCTEVRCQAIRGYDNGLESEREGVPIDVALGSWRIESMFNLPKILIALSSITGPKSKP
jgi:hypothetical protein